MPPDGLSASELEELAELTALKRLGSPEDVSRAVLYLIDADYVTGETLVVDGGKLLRG
jgi:NAD(P)-dependent dehydrogenase (short-subunit alcohol dehydrogenase family)